MAPCRECMLSLSTRVCYKNVKLHCVAHWPKTPENKQTKETTPRQKTDHNFKKKNTSKKKYKKKKKFFKCFLKRKRKSLPKNYNNFFLTSSARGSASRPGSSTLCERSPTSSTPRAAGAELGGSERDHRGVESRVKRKGKPPGAVENPWKTLENPGKKEKEKGVS